MSKYIVATSFFAGVICAGVISSVAQEMEAVAVGSKPAKFSKANCETLQAQFKEWPLSSTGKVDRALANVIDVLTAEHCH